MKKVTKAHLEELIETAEELGEEHFEGPGFDIPGGIYVDSAKIEFEVNGYDTDDIPYGALAMRAHEIRRKEDEEE